MKNKVFHCLCWLTAIICSLQMQAQNNIASPMKDVNQVVDNTLDSLNKARTARPAVSYTHLTLPTILRV